MSAPQPPGPPPQWPPTPSYPQPARRSGSAPTWLALLGVVLGLVGIGVGIWAVATRPDTAPMARATDPTYSAAEVSAAKQQLCAAVDLARSGVGLNTNLTTQQNENREIYDWINTAQARISLVSGAALLTERIDPAAPPDLARMARTLANEYLDIAAWSIADKPKDDPQHQQDIAASNGTGTELARLCK
jgi:hypothetical protein